MCGACCSGKHLEVAQEQGSFSVCWTVWQPEGLAFNLVLNACKEPHCEKAYIHAAITLDPFMILNSTGCLCRYQL